MHHNISEHISLKFTEGISHSGNNGSLIVDQPRKNVKTIIYKKYKNY